MTILVQQYTAHSPGDGARIVDQSVAYATAELRNLGPAPIYINAYSGTGADGSTDASGADGVGFPIYPGERISLPHAKFEVNTSADAERTGPGVFWVVFSS